MLVGLDDDRLLPALHLDRNDLIGEAALPLRRHGPEVGAQGKGVLLLASDSVLAAYVLGRLQHAAGDRVAFPARRYPCPCQPVGQLDLRTWAVPAQARRVVLDLAHALGAARPAAGDSARGLPGPGIPAPTRSGPARVRCAGPATTAGGGRGGGTSLKTPPNRPTAVLTGTQMTTSRIADHPSLKPD